MPAEVAALRNSGEPVWVFAYGSLLWDNEFRGGDAEQALLRGYHRSFCLYSYDYRGYASQSRTDARARPRRVLPRRGLRLPTEGARPGLGARDERPPGIWRAPAAGANRKGRTAARWRSLRCETARITPARCRSTRRRAGSSLPPAAAAHAAIISRIRCGTSSSSASRTARCAGSPSGSGHWPNSAGI